MAAQSSSAQGASAARLPHASAVEQTGRSRPIPCPARMGGQSCRSVLIVSDARPWSESTADFLTSHGLHVQWQSLDQTELVLGREVDIAVVDLMLPLSGGERVIRDLRTQSDAMGIIALTGPGSVGMRIRALDAGADNHTPRNMDPRVLLAVIRNLARRL